MKEAEDKAKFGERRIVAEKAAEEQRSAFQAEERG